MHLVLDHDAKDLGEPPVPEEAHAGEDEEDDHVEQPKSRRNGTEDVVWTASVAAPGKEVQESAADARAHGHTASVSRSAAMRVCRREEAHLNHDAVKRATRERKVRALRDVKMGSLGSKWPCGWRRWLGNKGRMLNDFRDRVDDTSLRVREPPGRMRARDRSRSSRDREGGGRAADADAEVEEDGDVSTTLLD